MTALMIAVRELRDRSRLLLFAAALAVLPFLAALFPGARANRTDVIAAVSSFLAIALSLGSAVGLGASALGRDLAERRLSFYFSKPVSPAAIWIGKAGASLFASLACFAIIAVPAALVARKSWPMLWLMSARQIVTITVTGVVVLFFLSHVLSTMIRSRSILIAVDFVLAAVAAAALSVLARLLLVSGGFSLAITLGAGVAAGVLFILAVAPVWQLAKGRTDIRRSHAALSKFLWPSIFALIAATAVYVSWAMYVTPNDLAVIQYFEQPVTGGRVFVSGLTRGRMDLRSSFLIDYDGKWKRLWTAPWSSVVFSRDGSEMLWLEPATFFPRDEVELHTTRGATGIRVRGYAEMALSDDGSRVALVSGSNVVVHDLKTGRLLASAGRFEPARRQAMYFLTNDLLRIIEIGYRTAGPLRVFELDIPAKKLVNTGETHVPSGDALMASPDGSRLLLRKSRKVLDARTAQILVHLPPSETSAAAVLSDGKVVEIRVVRNSTRLRVIGGRTTVLPVGIANVAGEFGDGLVLLSAAKTVGWSATGEGQFTIVVDVVQGRIAGLVPEVKGPRAAWWGTDPRLPRLEGQDFAGVDREGKVIWWKVPRGTS